ncbi:hypothetical protein I6I68_11315 [Corynebacterium glucuronolyticum]|uniref:hypothetical protein n=1 Tax=Corynebacterium glucuronolyticum TaxID=39791 RepID=UPI00191D70F3|nr:hypothetical protein [Corynebacterium glucuronolyticum]QQU88164.1 hypothetical protein I6I68_11315 [Corynebacterium glucuronolyticum]
MDPMDNVYEWRAFEQTAAFKKQAADVHGQLRAGEFAAALEVFAQAMPWDPGINDWDPADPSMAYPVQIVEELGGPVDSFVAQGAFTTLRAETFGPYSEQLTRLVEKRAEEFGLTLPAWEPVDLGILTDPQAPEAIWLPVPGMRGGFEITRWGSDRVATDKDADEVDAFQVRSWSRKDMGSGQRHRLTADGLERVPGGFD